MYDLQSMSVFREGCQATTCVLHQEHSLFTPGALFVGTLLVSVQLTRSQLFAQEPRTQSPIRQLQKDTAEVLHEPLQGGRS